ncbi:type II toxin-antitoxin system Phd/YefM family antitoxin [Scandinavium goeteborgense]|uniref:Antitoxin n=1 Tax=Scandinavium goeteborgense TaxID=1851514 RepID=A0A4R6F0M4_SCAGO|nr:type II toxin-antitoxin system prevent-host-death family antitoxin [Scandinavium goeteborgense]QKN82653.1 type II toxin-antitoxin system prevent-host-death family antitoxin [Scandinavium goeteborgense]TDN64806.1 antitoxin YefM [Scandinavium goeteborgense]
MQHVNYTDARQNLAQLMQQANDDRAPILVTRKGSKSVVVIDADEFAAIQETLHLFGNPANAAVLTKSLEQADSGDVFEYDPVKGTFIE